MSQRVVERCMGETGMDRGRWSSLGPTRDRLSRTLGTSCWPSPVTSSSVVSGRTSRSRTAYRHRTAVRTEASSRLSRISTAVAPARYSVSTVCLSQIAPIVAKLTRCARYDGHWSSTATGRARPLVEHGHWSSTARSRVVLRARGHGDLQHQQRDGDREDPVAERLHPDRTQPRSSCRRGLIGHGHLLREAAGEHRRRRPAE
jgi:hypothetical protein